MGGGGSSNKTYYQNDRIGVDARTYGELSQTGIQSQEEYNQYKQGQGVSTDSKYGTKSIKGGIDYDAAMKDWTDYVMERQEIATYEATEARRKDAPDELAGTGGSVDYSLAIEEDEEKKDGTVGGTTTIDSSPSTASTNQALGIY